MLNYYRESNFSDYQYENALNILDKIIDNIKHEVYSTGFISKISTLGSSYVKREGGIQFIIQDLLNNFILNQNDGISMLYEKTLKETLAKKYKDLGYEAYYINGEFIEIDSDELKRLKRREVDFIFQNIEKENSLMIEAKHINNINDIKTQIESLISQLNDIKAIGEVGVGMLVYSGEIETGDNKEYSKNELIDSIDEYRNEIKKQLGDNYILNTDLFEVRFNNSNGKMSFVCIDFVFDKTFYYKFIDNNYVDLNDDRYFENMKIDNEIEYGNIIKINNTHYLLIDDFIEFINDNGDWMDFIEPSYISLRKNDNLHDLINEHYFKPNQRYGYHG